MRFGVIGNGNLGTDLNNVLRNAGHHVQLITRADLKMPQSKAITYRSIKDYDAIFCTAGSGGPTHNIHGVPAQVESNISLPLEMMQEFTKKPLILFSSHYLNQDAQGRHSVYAKTKSLMEQIAEPLRNVLILRVGSLYGSHFPLKTLPGKIVKRVICGEKKFLFPDNYVTPTPTSWLAEQMLAYEIWNCRGVQNFGPYGKTTVFAWASSIVDQVCDRTGRNSSEIIVESRGVDHDYPFVSACEVGDDFEWTGTLWQRYSSEVIRAAIEATLRDKARGSAFARCPEPPQESEPA